MLRATKGLHSSSIPYIGPGAAALERCYDKGEAYQIAAAAGFDVPGPGKAFPMIAKPRRGSDSIGLKLLYSEDEKHKYSRDAYLVQEYLSGAEVTVAVLRGRAGAPLRIDLPEGTPYSFLRKYLTRPARLPFEDKRVAATALELARLFEIDWAARVDFIYERASGRLCFLECDAAPLIGTRSAFAESLARGGMPRAEQLRLLAASKR